MKIKLLILLLIPGFAIAQEVQPVESADYLARIKNDANGSRKIDSTNSMNKAVLHYRGYNLSGNFAINKISVLKGNTIKLHSVVDNSFWYGGAVSSNVTVQRINSLPAVQQQYVQGGSANGSLTWQGPHTNELFSYGPSINTLEFDGTYYPYDVNGRLVAAGTGNGRKAMIYTPSIFRTAALFSNAVTLQARYRKNYQQVLSTVIKAGQSNEKSFIVSNKNNAANFSASVEGTVKKVTLSSSYNYMQEKFSNSNRNGFLNRVYQNALLSPVSFDNKQGNTINALQRSYSLYADNPFFLLENNDHHFLQQHHTGNFTIEKKFKHSKIKLSQAFEKLQQQSNTGYPAGTAFFDTGMPLNRNTHDANYYFTVTAENNFYFTDYRLRGTLTGNYVHGVNRTQVQYAPNNLTYRYHRVTNDAVIGYAQIYNNSEANFETGVFLNNKIYTSSTAVTNKFFLPAISFYTRFTNVFNATDLAVKLKGNFNRFNSELPINTSFAQNALTQYAAVNALQHLPAAEASNFNGLQAIAHKEYSTGIELSYKYGITLSCDWFIRNTYNDVFPVMNSGQLQLVNMADHRNRGVEMELNLYPFHYYKDKLSFANSFSFTAYRSMVTAVKDNYNYTPIAGFSDVHKAIVKGAPLGAIVGSSFLKDGNNTIIIGANGFPMVNNTPDVIGNPVPDFIFKMSNHVSWKRWDLNFDWEWRKGGDMWNGTLALLDYYGRSANSAQLRNTTNYVFNGVDVNGKPNTVPVNFYDPSLPVEQNRWVRYGPTGVAASYIQKGDCIRLNNIAISFKPSTKKYLQQLNLSLYASNLILWSAYKGADVNQLLNDQPGTSGLDFFNIPSYHSFGFSVSIKF